MLDLNAALSDAAERATATREPVAAGTLLTRIHRRRALRRTGQTALGLAAIATVTLTGVALGGADIPPAHHDNSWPAAVTLDSVPRCGDPAPTSGDRSTGEAIHAEVTNAPTRTVPSGTAFGVSTALSLQGFDDRTDLIVTEPTTPMIVMVGSTGTVVGVAGGRTADAVVNGGGTSGSVLTGSMLVPTTACDGSGPLPAGPYWLYAVRTLAAGDPSTAIPDGGFATSFGGDGRLLVTGSATQIWVGDPVGGFAAPVPGCGGTTAGLATAPDLGVLTSETTVEVGTIVDTQLVHQGAPDVIEATLHVTNHGPTVDAASAVEKLAWIIAKDGRVVATGSVTADQTDPTADPTAWEYGGTRSLTFADNLTTCGSSGPLAPGSYQVWLLGDVPARLQPSTATWDNAGVVVGPITLVLAY